LAAGDRRLLACPPLPASWWRGRTEAAGGGLDRGQGPGRGGERGRQGEQGEQGVSARESRRGHSECYLRMREGSVVWVESARPAERGPSKCWIKQRHSICMDTSSGWLPLAFPVAYGVLLGTPQRALASRHAGFRPSLIVLLFLLSSAPSYRAESLTPLSHSSPSSGLWTSINQPLPPLLQNIPGRARARGTVLSARASSGPAGAIIEGNQSKEGRRRLAAHPHIALSCRAGAACLSMATGIEDMDSESTMRPTEI
jgi:hypothetical protein